MRLICPNCDAVYEVDPAAIPEHGRDVQCSNCGHAWFQLPAEAEARLAAEAEVFAPPPAVDAPPRRPIDESVLSVLREEAEREAAARRAEGGQIETQPELGLPSFTPAQGQPASTTETQRRIARLKGIDPDAPPPPPARPGSRRDLLPDIEEINSTLKPVARPQAADGDYEDVQGGKGGFRFGFVLSLFLAAVVLSGYVMAPQISARFPQFAPQISAYVAQVDQGRVWLDAKLKELTAIVKDLSSSKTGS